MSDLQLPPTCSSCLLPVLAGLSVPTLYINYPDVHYPTLGSLDIPLLLYTDDMVLLSLLELAYVKLALCRLYYLARLENLKLLLLANPQWKGTSPMLNGASQVHACYLAGPDSTSPTLGFRTGKGYRIQQRKPLPNPSPSQACPFPCSTVSSPSLQHGIPPICLPPSLPKHLHYSLLSSWLLGLTSSSLLLAGSWGCFHSRWHKCALWYICNTHHRRWGCSTRDKAA